MPGTVQESKPKEGKEMEGGSKGGVERGAEGEGGGRDGKERGGGRNRGKPFATTVVPLIAEHSSRIPHENKS